MTVGRFTADNELSDQNVNFLKDWQSSMTPKLRESSVENIFKSILPKNVSPYLGEERTKNLLYYAKKVENQMYERAESKEEYYDLISLKINRIRHEIEQRKFLRRLNNLNLVNTKSKTDISKSANLLRSIDYRLKKISLDQNSTKNYIVLNKNYDNSYIRKNIIKKIVNSILPLQDSKMANDPRFVRLFEYAQRLENEVYSFAKCKDDYFQILANKIYELKVELALKRRARKLSLLKDKESLNNSKQ